MNIFKNKYFLLGNLAFLLLAIPIALYFIKAQTSTRSSAASTTTLSFDRPISTNQCTSQTTTLKLNPDKNIVSTVQLSLTWDKTKFSVDFAPNTTAFPQTIKGPDFPPEGGSMTVTLNIGADVTKAISTTTDVGTLTIKPIADTGGAVVYLDIDPTNTKIYSLSDQDGVTENVFNAAGSSPLGVTITPQDCSSTSPSPTATVSAIPSQPISETSTPTPTATPTTATNQAPICLSLVASTASGAAPLSVGLTGAGQDNDGTLAKATFNFGDGTQQDVTTGLGTASGSAQISHTYNSGGDFTATANFTDNGGAISPLCSQVISVSGADATEAPTATPTNAPIATAAPTATPTINNPGGIGPTVGLIGGIVAAIVAGIFLLAL